jgi:hypothetical protein
VSELNELEHILFSLTNIGPDKLKYAARAIDFLISLDGEKLPLDQVIGNYERIKVEAKWQQYHLKQAELDQLRIRHSELYNEEKAVKSLESYAKPAEAKSEVKSVRIETVKKVCNECPEAQTVDAKNCYCPKTGKVYNRFESHECQPVQLKPKVKTVIKPITDKKILEEIGEYEPTPDELKAKAVYDRNYRPITYSWQTRNNDLLDTAALHDSTLTRRENNQLIRDYGKAEYQKDMYQY